MKALILLALFGESTLAAVTPDQLSCWIKMEQAIEQLQLKGLDIDSSINLATAAALGVPVQYGDLDGPLWVLEPSVAQAKQQFKFTQSGADLPTDYKTFYDRRPEDQQKFLEASLEMNYRAGILQAETREDRYALKDTLDNFNFFRQIRDEERWVRIEWAPKDSSKVRVVEGPVSIGIIPGFLWS